MQGFELVSAFAGVLVGEVVGGAGCASGAIVGAVLKLGQMGATTAVMAGTGVGVGVAGGLCIVGAMAATAVAYSLS